MPAGAPLTETELWRRHDDAEQRLTAPVSERMLELARLERGDLRRELGLTPLPHHRGHHLGLLVETEHGRMVPVLDDSMNHWLRDLLARHAAVAGTVHVVENGVLAIRAAHNIPRSTTGSISLLYGSSA